MSERAPAAAPRFIPLVLLAMGLGAGVLAQQPPAEPAAPGAPAPPAGPPAAPGAQRPKMEDLPPQIRLGIRAEGIRRAWPVAPVVVVVPDGASYLRAVEAWTLKSRWPVLIDDGSDRAREDIARFVRGFRPQRVVRWSALDAAGDAAVLPEGPARREAIEGAVRRVWSGVTPIAPPKDQAGLIEAWVNTGVPPPGIVVADEADPAWPAALALSAGRAQPIAWVKTETGVNSAFEPAALAALAEAVEGACERTGLAWRALGDQIDAVTLCLNAPAKAKVEGSEGAVLATTDLVGRLARDPGAPPPPPDAVAGPPAPRHERWGWAGQVFGDEPRSAYAAMCGLFLWPRSAWVFDGYPGTDPWHQYDGTSAAEQLRKGGMTAAVEDAPRQGERQWRLHTAAGLDEGLVLVNTKGMGDEFELEPGKCRTGDVPLMRVPAAVHFVHSWSATLPAERGTVAGRWLERGAYAYAGAVHEPYLQGFVPTPVVAARLMVPCPWGASVRHDGQRAWKVAVIGDPLITFGPEPAKAEPGADGSAGGAGGAGSAGVPLEGAIDLSDEARHAVTERDFPRALRLLAMLGRDSDAARLAGAVLRDDPRSVTPALAREAVPILARTRDAASLARAYSALPTADAADPVLRDHLWLAAYPELDTTRDQTLVSVLRSNLRADQAARDAADIAPAVLRVLGKGVAFKMLADEKERAANASDKARVSEALLRLTTGRGEER